ncbi:FtsX-like permease family protein [bacterium D16-51]|nr:FtsX-like permease family protein [bacterium D16-59]RKI56695.1 FtsX-like permease family protein [bacterium D16-51]
MKYIFKNIKSFAKNYTKIFVLLIITTAASTLIIHLSYGMFREYRDRRELSRRGTNQVVFRLEGSYVQKPASEDDGNMIMLGDLKDQIYEKQDDRQDVTAADMKRFAQEVDAETADKLLNIHTGILQEKYRFETDFLISDGKIVNSGDYGFDSLYNFSFGGRTQNIFQYGRYFTDQEYTKGERVCIMYGFQKNLRGDYLEKNLLEDGKVLIGGQEYQIIGLQNGIGSGYLPITSVDGDSVLLDEIALRFRDNISLREISLLNDAAKKCFGSQIISNYELEEMKENSYLYNTILLLVLVVSLVAAFNFCALYHYIVTTRRRTLKIFRICGLNHRKSIWLYLGECSVLSMGTYLAALLLFHFLLMPFLAGKMSIFDFHYKAEVYLVLFLVYFISSFLLQYAMVSWNLKRKMVR